MCSSDLPGVLQVLDANTVAFADLRGNRQYVTVGNLRRNDRVSLFLLDQGAQARLKLLGRARIVEAGEGPEAAALLARLAVETSVKVERALVVQVDAFDWNCSKHIVPRYTAADVEAVVAPMRQRIWDLEEAARGRRQS